MSTHNKEAAALLPCPFCGGEPTWIHHSTRFDGRRLMSLGCCGFRKVGPEDELAPAWNRRSALTASEAPATEQAPTPQYSWSTDGKTVLFENFDECMAFENRRSEQAPVGKTCVVCGFGKVVPAGFQHAEGCSEADIEAPAGEVPTERERNENR